MEIQRIDIYTDNRFSREALYQHGCFLVDKMPFEIEIISDFEAIIRGKNPNAYVEVIKKFRFYTPHITMFYDKHRQLIKEYPPAKLLTLCTEQIQPSQFFVDEDKIAAVSTFIKKPSDIIIPVLPFDGRYISLDGHTRLRFAVMNGWDYVRAVTDAADDSIYNFAKEAQRRGIYTPKDMAVVCHEEYETKWNCFCDNFLSEIASDRSD